MTVIILLLSLYSASAKVILNDDELVFSSRDGVPYSYGNTYMLPLDTVAKAFGASVVIDNETSSAIITKGVTTAVINTSEYAVYRNGTKIALCAPLEIKNGHMYIPAELLSALDATVYVNSDTVVITTPDYSNVVKFIRTSSGINSNYWNPWNEARNLKNSGRYYEALDKYNSFASSVVADGNTLNTAILFSEYGECYAGNGAQRDAAACYTEAAKLYLSVNMPEDAKICTRKAEALTSTVQLFAASYDEAYRGSKYFRQLYEPENGIYLGATLKNSNPENMVTYPQTVSKEMAGYLIYADIHDEPYEKYKDVFNAANQYGCIVQYALQPGSINDLLSVTEDDERYIRLAIELNNTGSMILLRFASEMNDPSNAWYTKNTGSYIKSFRAVANIFRKYAPNVAIVWSPNFYPEETIANYYPGDEYVDYVGISAYCEHQPGSDGIDRQRFASLLDKIVSLYGHKKPIIISESGASYSDPNTGADITEFASRQIKDFYTYLPIKYPQVKAAYIFETVDAKGTRQFQFYANDSYFNAYRSSILSNVSYLGKFTENSDTLIPYYFEIGNGVILPPAKLNIYSYVKTYDNETDYVAYHINGEHINKDLYTGAIPYGMTIDFSPYAGQDITLELRAFRGNALCASKTYTVHINASPSYDNTLGDSIHQPQGTSASAASLYANGGVVYSVGRILKIILIVLGIIAAVCIIIKKFAD